jgi:hypothetical protein
MKCPYCDQELDILPRCYKNIETYYPHRALCTTECCGKIVYLRQESHFVVQKYTGDKTEDDWGIPAKEQK